MSATNPPTLNSRVFEDTSIEKIIVPKSAINAYKAATGWSQYADKIVYEVDSSDLPDTSNFVTLSGAQTISGNKTFTGINTFNSTLTCPSGIMSPTIYPGGGNSLTVPKKNGTIATTSDIPIKTATLSGTTLSITLS